MIDILISIVLLFFGLLGFRDGFVKMSFAITALLIGIVAATKFMDPVGNFLISVLFLPEGFSFVFAFALVFVGIMVIERVIYGLREAEDTGVFLISEKVFAIWLGFLEGAAVVSVVLVLLGAFDVPSVEVQQNSLFYKPLSGFAPWIYDKIVEVLPQSIDFYGELGKNLEKYREVVPR